MQDDRGLYYYPNPADTNVRVYVREGESGAEFRLWHGDHPIVWEKHAWIPQTTLEKAAAMYRDMGNNCNPMALYDIAVAGVLLREERHRKERG